MTTFACGHDHSGEVLCMIPGPTKVLAVAEDQWRWCFNCRRRTLHGFVVLGDEKPSYYDPIGVRLCSDCGGDHTTFPGTIW